MRTSCIIFMKNKADLLPFLELLSVKRINMKVHYYSWWKDYDMYWVVDFKGISLTDLKKTLVDYPWFTKLIVDYHNYPQEKGEYYHENRAYFDEGHKTFPIVPKKDVLESLPYLYCYQLKALAMLYEIPNSEKMRRVKLLNALKKHLEPPKTSTPPPPPSPQILPHSLEMWNYYVDRIHDIMKRVNKNVKYADAVRVANALKHNQFIREDQVIAYVKGIKA
jgi:hypothetical protein